MAPERADLTLSSPKSPNGFLSYLIEDVLKLQLSMVNLEDKPKSMDNVLVPMTPIVAEAPTVMPPVSVTTAMQIIWHGEFNRLFGQFFPDTWVLAPWSPTTPPNNKYCNWKIFKDSAKVRFICQKCSNCWTSMKGRVIFWYHLSESNPRQGTVFFKLFGQQCRRCKTTDFEHAMWYPEEVIKVVGNVYNRIGQLYYGFVSPPLRIDRRAGKPREQHNSSLCAACKDGLCRDEWVFS